MDKKSIQNFFLALLIFGGGLLVVNFIFFANQSTPPSNSTAAPIVVSAAQLTSEYASNEVAADSKYKNQYLQISGNVDSVNTDLFGNPYVVITTGSQLFNEIQCSFSQDQESSLTLLQKGDPIVVDGIGNGYVITDVMVKNCSVVSSEVVNPQTTPGDQTGQ
jgi:hypothetical protein